MMAFINAVSSQMFERKRSLVAYILNLNSRSHYPFHPNSLASFSLIYGYQAWTLRSSKA